MTGDTIVARTTLAVPDGPTTPQDVDAVPSSQQSFPSTEGPASPIAAAGGDSFRTEPNDDRAPSSSVIPSSLTPPPSSQVLTSNGPRTGTVIGSLLNSQRARILSPPVTVSNNVRRDVATRSSEYTAPTPHQVVQAAPEELRSMLQACIAEHAKLKMETAHHKLQYSLLRIQADEDAKRAAVEHEMTRREVDALRVTEQSQQARREVSTASDSTQARYLQLQYAYENVLADKEALRKKLKGAKKLIQETKEDNVALKEERELLTTRIRENREHFNQLRSPGGMFYGISTPKTQQSSPAQHRSTPKQTPRSAIRDQDRVERNRGQPLDILAQVANREEYGHAEPSTPNSRFKAAKHTRGAQSMSSLPTTPIGKWPQSKHAGLLPSMEVVPQTEPPNRHSSRTFVPDTPDRDRTRGRSRDSTISAEDERERKEAEYEQQRQVALQALAFESVSAAHNTTTSSMRTSGSGRHNRPQEEEEVYESQASQKATELLRHDPRQSFDVASSNNSRDVTPTPVAIEKSAKLQSKLFAPHTKSGLAHEKRKFSGPERDDRLDSPTKRLRLAGGLREDGSHVGLGIH